MFLPRKTLIATAGALLALWGHSPVALAQATNDTELSDQERAKRDANKVFRFIKFHSVRPAVAAAPAKPAERAETKILPATPEPATQLSALDTARPSKTLEPDARAEPAPVAQAAVDPGISLPVVPLPPANSVEPVPELEAEPDVGLQLISHVEPEVPMRYASQLRSGSVKVRFMVGPEGKVVSASAREGAQRHLANAAVRAVQQWRFAPLPAAREAEVEIAFKLDDL